MASAVRADRAGVSGKVGRAAGGVPQDCSACCACTFCSQWYSLSDPAVEEALYDSRAMRRFVGIDLGREAVPAETTACKFRHLLNQHGIASKLFACVQKHMQSHVMKLSRGTIVDATIIHAPASTRNKSRKRDPQMHQTRKGNQWYFGMKAHIGKAVHADAGYSGADKRAPKRAPALLHRGQTRQGQGDHRLRNCARSNLWMARKRLLAATG